MLNSKLNRYRKLRFDCPKLEIDGDFVVFPLLDGETSKVAANRIRSQLYSAWTTCYFKWSVRILQQGIAVMKRGEFAPPFYDRLKEQDGIHNL